MAGEMKRSKGLHPEALAYLERVDALGVPPLESMAAGEARSMRNAAMIANGGEGERVERVEELRAPGLRGEIALRLYAETTEAMQPCVVYFHGGGYVYGDLDTHDAVCRAMAKEAGATVIAVDYGLAPEVRYPAAVDDAYAAMVWVADEAERLGVDVERISVAGDSAGGGLAAVMALRCRDEQWPRLVGQVLVYPVADLSALETGSYREFAEGYGLTRAAMAWFREQYLAEAGQRFEVEASPLLEEDLRGLPPALVVTAEFDPLRDEGEAYAERLKAAGVRVTQTRYAGMIHGFFSMRGVMSDGRAAMREVGAFLRAVNGG
jgi:acetyl esterase